MDIIVGDRYHVKVVAVKERLVVVEFEDSSTSIIHISKICIRILAQSISILLWY